MEHNAWEKWQAIADQEVRRILRHLPPPLRASAEQLPVVYGSLPSHELKDDGIKPDTLGLFVGEPWAETGATATPLPAQIILFLENLIDMVEGNEAEFREEVTTTYLHELGHYLGLDEGELEDRGLQ